MTDSLRAFLVFLALLGADIRSAFADAAPMILSEGVFCETEVQPEAPACSPEPVRLPHNWSPERRGLSLGLYRFEIPRPAPGAYAVLADRLSLDGAVSVDGRIVIDRLDPEHVGRQRYWPLIGRFEVEAGVPGPLVVEARIRGHDRTKNGLGALRILPLAEAETEHHRSLLIEVLLLSALAAGSITAGVMGLFIGAGDSRAGRVLGAVSGLSILSGLRCFHNLTTDPPLGPAEWLAVGNSLLVLIALQAAHVVLAYFIPSRRLSGYLWMASLGLVILLMATGATPASVPIVNILSVLLVGAGAILLMILALRAVRDPDTLGVSILGAFGVVVATGAHDLVIHLSDRSLSDRYLQTWALPILLILALAALARRTAEQRNLQSALHDANTRREDLLRDLHDRVGSRLVALAFHAQEARQSSGFLEEIRSLIHEVRMIQGAVATDATTLDALLADLRHAYSRVGGGRLPLRWDLPDASPEVRLSPEQAVAVVRIIEEAIANAVKHAGPESITIRLSAGEAGDLGVLDIEDDGAGELKRAPAGGGLNNMFARAEQAGIRLELIRGPGKKAVRIRFTRSPATRTSRWGVQGLRIRR